MANTGSFRSAINGFNRQDVQEYLESAANRYNTLKKERNDLEKLRQEQAAQLRTLEENAAQWEPKLASLQAELETARARNAELEVRLPGLQEELEAANARLSEAGAALEAEKAARSAAEAACRSAGDESEERRQLQLRLTEAEAKAEEYALVKDRLATLELDASRRAAEIEREAQRSAEEILRKAREEADALRRAAEAEAGDLRRQALEADDAQTARRTELAESFRTSLRDAARETGNVAGSLDQELGRFAARLQELRASLESSADRFGTLLPAQEEKECACAAEEAQAPQDGGCCTDADD